MKNNFKRISLMKWKMIKKQDKEDLVPYIKLNFRENNMP